MTEYWKKYWNNIEKCDNLELLDGYAGFDVLTVKILSNELIEILNIKEDSKILEIGCGAGAISQFLYTNFNKYDYTGIDFSEKLIKYHSNKFPNHKLINCEANKIPLDSKSFDIVFCWSVFQYFPSLNYANEVIKEMERLSKNIIFIGDLRTQDTEKLYYEVYSTYPIEFFIYNGWKSKDKPQPLHVTSYNVIKKLDEKI